MREVEGLNNTDRLIGLIGCTTKGVFAYKFGVIDRDLGGNLYIEFPDGNKTFVDIADLTVLVDKK